MEITYNAVKQAEPSYVNAKRFTLGQLLKMIQDQVTVEDESELLDMEVSIRVPHSCGQYCVNTYPQAIKTDKSWNNTTKKHTTKITLECGFIS